MKKSWEQKAKEACERRGLTIVPCGFEGGYVFVKSESDTIFPIGEYLVAEWIKDDE